MGGTTELEIYLPWLGMLLGAVSLWAAMRANRKRRIIDDTPTCKTTGVFIGLVELKGVAEAEQPIVGYLSHKACVHYTWSVDEHWSRTVTETYTDADGKRQTRTRHESGWTTVASGGEMIPFYLRDAHGAIRVVPTGAKIEPIRTFQRTCRPSDPLYYEKGPLRAVSDSDHRRQFTEYGIPLRTRLYVIGQARQRRDIVAAEIARDPHAPMFLISTRNEQSVSTRYALKYWLLSLLAGVLVVGGWVIPSAQTSLDVAAVLLLSLAGFSIVWLAAWVWMAYNSLVSIRERVAQAWAQIDVELKRRHDLIPGLVEVVTQLRDHEREVQTMVAQLRSQLRITAPGDAGTSPRALSQPLAALVEAYPELQSHEQFTHLQRELARTEDRISLARSYFNEMASYYNTRLAAVPDRYVARLAGMKRRKLMHADGFERQPVELTFANAEP